MSAKPHRHSVRLHNMQYALALLHSRPAEWQDVPYVNQLFAFLGLRRRKGETGLTSCSLPIPAIDFDFYFAWFSGRRSLVKEQTTEDQANLERDSGRKRDGYRQIVFDEKE